MILTLTVVIARLLCTPVSSTYRVHRQGKRTVGDGAGPPVLVVDRPLTSTLPSNSSPATWRVPDSSSSIAGNDRSGGEDDIEMLSFNRLDSLHRAAGGTGPPSQPNQLEPPPKTTATINRSYNGQLNFDVNRISGTPCGVLFHNSPPNNGNLPVYAQTSSLRYPPPHTNTNYMSSTLPTQPPVSQPISNIRPTQNGGRYPKNEEYSSAYDVGYGGYPPGPPYNGQQQHQYTIDRSSVCAAHPSMVGRRQSLQTSGSLSRTPASPYQCGRDYYEQDATMSSRTLQPGLHPSRFSS